MAQDPRKFLVNRKCPAKNTIEQARKKNFFDSLGRVGDLEVLNEIDNDIGKGLRTLGQISENVRNSAGPVPSVIRETGAAALEAGSNFVLETLGFNPRETRTQARQFNPQVANRAIAQAESIYENVRNGRLDEFEDVPQAIADFANLEILTRSIFTPTVQRESRFKGACVSPYARDLIERAPKHKFMYVVEFVLNEPYASEWGDLGKELAFVVKRTGRPNISFDYEEVNFYNFRTKVLKRKEYQPVNMVFYDDNNGNATRFFEEYIRAISPLVRSSDPRLFPNSSVLEESGMNYDDFLNLTAGTSTLQSPTPGATPTIGEVTPKTIIKQIRLYHVYKSGTKYDVYSFGNPKILEWQLDELDMTQTGDGTEVSLSFSYDILSLLTAADMTNGVSIDLADLTGDGQFPLRPNPQAGVAVTDYQRLE